MSGIKKAPELVRPRSKKVPQFCSDLKNGVNGQVKCSIFGHQKCCRGRWGFNCFLLSIAVLPGPGAGIFSVFAGMLRTVFPLL